MARIHKKISVVVIDDSALMRKELSAIIESDPEMEVLAVAESGEIGLEKVKELQPDVVTIDLNMPGMDGISCLQYIMIETPRPCVIISAYAGKDSVETFEALELGAVDFIQKPSGEISRDISSQARNIIRSIKGAVEVNLSVMKIQKACLPTPKEKRSSSHLGQRPDKVVVIGVSTGGPRSLMQLASTLPMNLGAPILIIQHMPENFTTSFAERLNTYCMLNVREARHEEELLNNQIYLAPGGYHLTLAKQNGRTVVHTLRASKKDLIVPSVDDAMHSAINIFEERTIGVILTGMGRDGSEAMARLHNLGGCTIAESEETAVIFGMPKEVIALGAARIIAPLDKISDEIIAGIKKL